jgi:outer membrane protein assembly factor BamE (lipoprotein component of BamABCDE complex)
MAMLNYLKNHIYFFIFISLFILNSCKLQEPTKNHGILYLENRANKLSLNNSNLNDALRVLGNPHFKSINNSNEWIYVERVLSKGEFIKLGQNIIKENNVLVLTFDKYGVLKEKVFIDKFSKNELKFSTDTTENKLSQKSFVEKFLESLKKKMYKK